MFEALFSRLSVALVMMSLLTSSTSAMHPPRSNLETTLNIKGGNNPIQKDIDGVPDAKYCPTKFAPVPFDCPAGWEGGYAESNPEFFYPEKKPDLSSIPITTNLANIDKITRQIKIKYPIFSWQMVPGDETTRCYVKFSEDISRIGYDDKGRIWSIICPQQGFKTGCLGEFNIEYTVTGVRGWVNEPKRSVGCEIGVLGQAWFSTDKKNARLKAIATLWQSTWIFPMQKANPSESRQMILEIHAIR